MAAPTTSFNRLQELLRELFQFDRADLDFGIYRIMNQRRDEVDRFLEQDLLPQVRDVLGQFSEQQQTSKQVELDDLGRQLRDAGVEPEASPKYLALKREIESAGQLEAIEAEVYSDLFTFFSRYYDEGDFISQRRYKAGVYAIPFEGEEVKLHWANADQYYVKTTEDFQDYRFKLGDGRHVHLKLVAADTERDNNKAENGKDRRFILQKETPAAEAAGDLELYFEYTPSQDKQSDLNEQAVATILADSIVNPWLDSLCQATGNKTLLEKHLHTYTAKNSFDYFIHKDLGGFLRRELDFFLKNEVAHLDDLENADAQRADQYLARLRTIRRIGHKIIDFLTQLEDFQKQLYLKTKFVLKTDYLVTMDRVPGLLHDQVVANDAQWAEWSKLFGFDHKINQKQRTQTLMDHHRLVLDTAHFDEPFRQSLLNNIENLDAQISGVLAHGDNFHVLELAKRRYKGAVRVVYSDPPYNREGDDFLYKDTFKHSSWLSMMRERIDAAKPVLEAGAVLFFSVDDNELYRLAQMLEQQLGEDNFLATLARRTKAGGGSAAHYFAVEHDYVVVWSNSKSNVGPLFVPFDDEYLKRYSESDQDGRYFWDTMERSSTQTKPYKIQAPDGTMLEGSFFRSEDRFRDDLAKGDVRIVKVPGGSWSVQFKQRLGPGKKLRSLLSGNEYKSSQLELEPLGLSGAFDYPKPVKLLEQLLLAATHGHEAALCMDFFAGSGTTAQAVINLNRRNQTQLKFFLAEMGNHFDRVMKPRVLKGLYSSEWENGVPATDDGVTSLCRVVRLESYDDALSNIDLKPQTESQRTFLDGSSAVREDYILHYMLDAESAESSARLNLEQFANPFEYQIKTVQGGETKLTPVDLPETFNWLLGLTVEKMRFIDGYQTVEGTDPDGQRVLVIWRNLTDENHSNENLEAFFRAQDFLERETETRLDHVYVNGDCTLSSVKGVGNGWQLHLTEEAFQRLMFDTHEGGR